jgi:uncharacterized membrane protein
MEPENSRVAKLTKIVNENKKSINTNSNEYQELFNYLHENGFIPLESDMKHIIYLVKQIKNQQNQ